MISNSFQYLCTDICTCTYLSSLKISIFKFNNDDIMPVPMSFVSKLLPGFCLILLLALLAFPVDSMFREKKVIK